ncbi:Flp pilus assembly protein CpaB [Pleionea litopenaei]|uniref:Flp pilus assembly protein CpaB n=1 Tax=Pleionea litopenaei TaxID=3070815 RepID=A0AA51X6V3_9GAMM|nr:Flp pilus assembly protein CpaB [Pleionea sp. HL-JVS1]WMS87249.1 Flp pilus assembly protein CpaB [Pleionea sp. HL-JVS1]
MAATQNIKSWGILAFAIAIAAVAFWLTTTYLSQKESNLRNQIENEQGEMVPVVVASTDVKPGDVLSGQNMAVAEVPAEFVSGSAVSPQDFGLFEGQVVRHYMTPGEPLLNHYVAGLGIERFSDLLDSGERAVTLEIDNLNSVAGMILPGDFVDIMLVADDESNSLDPNAMVRNLKPLLQKVRILAVDALSLVSKEQDFVTFNNGADSLSYSSVTVGVSFDDAAKLILARDVGDIVFMLRNKEDINLLKADLVTKQDLMGAGSGASQTYKFFGGSQAANGVITPTTKTFQQSVTTLSAYKSKVHLNAVEEIKKNASAEVNSR